MQRVNELCCHIKTLLQERERYLSLLSTLVTFVAV